MDRSTRKEGSIDLLKIWDWIKGIKRKKLRIWLAENRKRRRAALHYKEPKDEVDK